MAQPAQAIPPACHRDLIIVAQPGRTLISRSDNNPRRGIFASVPDLIAGIEEYLNAHNADPAPYVWTATAESIDAKVQRARTKLEQVVNQN
jgi:hypothetical protein